MRRVFNALAAVLVATAFGSMVFAQAPSATHPAKKPAAMKTEKKPASLAASGKVATFDEATKTLTLTTKEGPKEFMLGADAKVMAGASTVPTSDLAGKNVKVTYSHVDGKNVASKVTIAASHEAAAKPTAKK
jgi:hypothetical protein